MYEKNHCGRRQFHSKEERPHDVFKNKMNDFLWSKFRARVCEFREVPSDFWLSHSVEDTYSSPRQHAVKVWTHGMHLCVFTLSGTLLCVFFIYDQLCQAKKNGVKIISGALLPNIGHGIHDSMISLSNLLTENISPNIFECLNLNFVSSTSLGIQELCGIVLPHSTKTLIILSVYRVRWYS